MTEVMCHLAKPANAVARASSPAGAADVRACVSVSRGETPQEPAAGAAALRWLSR